MWVIKLNRNYWLVNIKLIKINPVIAINLLTFGIFHFINVTNHLHNANKSISDSIKKGD